MLVIFLLAALAAESAAASPPPAFTATQIRRDVGRDGATATVQALSRAGQWVVVENGVASGDPDWVALAPAVAPGTDAGTAEGLSMALADALPKAPAAVLGVITLTGASPLNVARVCTAPFIEDPPAHHAAYLKTTLKALERPEPSAVETARRACLARLRDAR